MKGDGVKFLLAHKAGMTSIFADDGTAIPVTVLQAGPCVVTQVKTTDRDGYDAVQVGFGEHKKIGKSRAGHLKAAKSQARHLAEFRPADRDYKVGEVLGADTFAEGDKVTVRATSKGKGFAGTIKRHNFSRGPKTHGSKNYRAPGSIGAGYPEHVMRGMRMAGRMGGEQVTVKNLPVVRVDADNHLIAVRGAVPGPRRALVRIELVSAAQAEEASE